MIRAVRRYFPNGTRMAVTQGGLNLLVVFPDRTNSFELNEKLKPFNIGIAPGALFNSGEKQQNCMLLNCSAMHDETIEQALKSTGQQACLLTNRHQD